MTHQRISRYDSKKSRLESFFSVLLAIVLVWGTGITFAPAAAVGEGTDQEVAAAEPDQATETDEAIEADDAAEAEVADDTAVTPDSDGVAEDDAVITDVEATVEASVVEETPEAAVEEVTEAKPAAEAETASEAPKAKSADGIDWDALVVGGTLPASAFAGRSDVSSLVVPASVSSLEAGAFASMASLSSIDLSQTSLTTLPSSTFSGDSALTSVALPASLQVIGDAAFAGCSALRAITIPAGVTSIGSGAFPTSVQTLEFLNQGNDITIADDAFTYVRGGAPLSDAQTIIGHDAANAVRDLESFGHGGYFRYVDGDADAKAANESVVVTAIATTPDAATGKGVQTIVVDQTDDDAVARDVYVTYDLPDGMTVDAEPTWEGTTGDAAVEEDRVVARADTVSPEDIVSLSIPYTVDEAMGQEGSETTVRLYADEPAEGATPITTSESDIMPAAWTQSPVTITAEPMNPKPGETVHYTVTLSATAQDIYNACHKVSGPDEVRKSDLRENGWGADITIQLPAGMTATNINATEKTTWSGEGSSSISWDIPSYVQSSYTLTFDAAAPKESGEYTTNVSVTWTQEASTYITSDSSYAYGTFQAEADASVTIVVSGPGHLTIQKVVEGTTTDEYFQFTATFVDAEGQPYSDPIPYSASPGAIVVGAVDGSVTPSSGGVVSFSLQDGDSVEFELPAGVTYSVSEAMAGQGWLPVEWNSSPSGTIEDGVSVGFTATNIKETGSLSVTKVVDGEGAGPFSFTAVFTNADGTPYTDAMAYTVSGTGSVTGGAGGTVTPNGSGVVSFTLDANATVTFTDLPDGVTYTITEMTPTGDWDAPQWSGNGGTVTGSSVSGVVTGGESAGFTCVNTPQKPDEPDQPDEPITPDTPTPPDNPTTPTEPGNPGAPNNPTPEPNVALAQTGDTTNLTLVFVLLILSAIAIVLARVRMRALATASVVTKRGAHARPTTSSRVGKMHAASGTRRTPYRHARHRR